ncbi:MAG: MFS transporter [Alphaproteobacteria bacterium]|nr:MFS transporter [Alphaproteobacteria bacterium]
MRDKLHYLFLNVGHFLDHLFMLVFATVAALALGREWGMSYGELIPYATPGFIAFGAFALPAGWLADRWSREGLITVYFVGIGLAACATALATTPVQIGMGLFAIGAFAAIYHPVGIALVLEGHTKTGMRIAINGVWGNMGVAAAALLTAFLIDTTGWRSAFVWPGAISVALGVAYGITIWRTAETDRRAKEAAGNSAKLPDPVFGRAVFIRVLAVIFFTTALGGLVFQSTTFALPKVLDERASDIAASATLIGWLAFFAFAVGSMGQLVVGSLVDRTSPRTVFMVVAAMQVVFFAAMAQATGWYVVLFSVAFMLATFGQIPINDVLVGRVAKSAWRSRILALRYTITITIMASSVPFIAWVHGSWGFDRLFVILSVAAAFICIAVATLPAAISGAKPQLAPAE